MKRAIVVVAAAVTAGALCACGGGGSSGPGGGSIPSTPSQVPLQGLPASGVSFSALGSAAQATISVTQQTSGTISETDTCANTIAQVATSVPTPQPSASPGAALTVTITPHAPGSCSIHLSGAGGANASVPVSVALQDVTPSVQWNASMGPRSPYGSGKLNALLVDPLDGKTMYVAGGAGAADNVETSAGVYKSTDGAATWQPADTGLGDTTVNALWMEPANPQTLVAVTQYGGIFKTTNGAQTWVQTSVKAPVMALEAAGGTLYAAGPRGIEISSDDGTTWTTPLTISGQAESVAVAGSTIYIGDTHGNLYVSKAGAAPAQIYTFPSSGLTPDVHELAVDTATPATVYAAIDGYSNNIYSANFYASGDGGMTWKNIPIPMTYRGAQSIVMSSASPHLLYILGTGCAGTADLGVTLTPCGGFGDGRLIQTDTQLPAIDVPAGGGGFGAEPLLVTGDQGGLIDDGSGASLLTAGLSVNIVRSLVVSGKNTVVTMQDWAPQYTADGGGSWTSTTTASSENGFLFENPASPSHCYLVDTYARISTDGCHTLDDTDHGYGGSSGGTTSMAFDPAHAPRAYLATANGVYVANDGVTFQPTGWPIASPMNVAVDPLDSSTIFVSAYSSGTTNGTVYYTHDGGATWSTSAGITAGGEYYPGDAPVIAVSPVHDWMVFAATATEMFRSVDGGKTFVSVAKFTPDTALADAARRRMLLLRSGSDDDKPARLFHPQNDTASASVNVGETLAFSDSSTGGAAVPLVYTLPSRGVQISTDYGTHWHDGTANAISRWFSQVAFQQGTMYAATMGEGVISSASPLAGASAARQQRFSLNLTRP